MRTLDTVTLLPPFASDVVLRCPGAVNRLNEIVLIFQLFLGAFTVTRCMRGDAGSEPSHGHQERQLPWPCTRCDPWAPAMRCAPHAMGRGLNGRLVSDAGRLVSDSASVSFYVPGAIAQRHDLRSHVAVHVHWAPVGLYNTHECLCA